jgi:putative transposase
LMSRSRDSEIGHWIRDLIPTLPLDALVIKSREAGRIVNVAVVIATAVTKDGQRTILGCDVITSEDGAGWTAFLRSLVARGLSGVKLIISDAHGGLKNAIATVLPGSSWQRCRTHFMRNLLCKVPKKAQPAIGALVRSIFTLTDVEEVNHQFAYVVGRLSGQFPQAAELLADAEPDLLAFNAFPQSHWRLIWSNYIHRNGSTGKSAAIPMWWAFSLTGRQLYGWLALCWPNRMTNGPLPDAT